MSLSAYTARTWSDYGQEPTYPEVSAANLNRIETGIAAVTADVLSLEAALPSTYQPLSAELSALAGLSSTGYAKRSGAASWSVVPSIPQSDVTGLTAALAGLQPLDSDLTAIAALTTANFGRSLLTVADAAAARTALGAQVAGSYEPATSAGTTAQYWRGDKSWQTLNSSAVGLGSVLNVAQEPALGSSTAGYLLSSTGTTRSWVAPYTHPATHPQSVVDSASGWITTALAGKQASGSYLTTSYIPTWASVSGKPSTFAPSAHTHIITDVTGLQSALDGKQSTLGYTPLRNATDTFGGILTVNNGVKVNGTKSDVPNDTSVGFLQLWDTGNYAYRMQLLVNGNLGILGTNNAGSTWANTFEIDPTGNAKFGGNIIPSGVMRGASRSSDGGTMVFAPATGARSAISNGTGSTLINRYDYAGWMGFISGGNTGFFGITQDHNFSGSGNELSIVAGAGAGHISFFAGTPTLLSNGCYQAPLVGDWTPTGLSIVGNATISGTTTIGTTWKLFETTPYYTTQLNIGFSSTTVMTMNNSLAVSMLGGLSVAADLSVAGAVKAGSKGIFRDYANNGSSYNYTSIYAAAAGTPAASNYSFASDWTGSYLNASTNCNLAINGNIILNARVDSINANQAIIANQGITIASGKLLFGGSVSMGCPNKVVQAYSSGGAALASAAAISLNYLNVINPSNSNVNYYIPTTTTVGAMIEILLCGTGSGPVGSKVYANTTGSQIISHNGALVTYISASTISTYYRLVWDGIYWVNCK